MAGELTLEGAARVDCDWLLMSVHDRCLYMAEHELGRMSVRERAVERLDNDELFRSRIERMCVAITEAVTENFLDGKDGRVT